jgi:hypothetical protein
VKDIITIQVVDTAAGARAKMAEEDAEDVKETDEDGAEEETTLLSI